MFERKLSKREGEKDKRVRVVFDGIIPRLAVDIFVFANVFQRDSIGPESGRYGKRVR